MHRFGIAAVLRPPRAHAWFLKGGEHQGMPVLESLLGLVFAGVTVT